MLTQATPNQFRIFCLLSPYTTNIDYSKDRIVEAASIEKKFFEFFVTLSNSIAENSNKFQSKKWRKEDQAFYLKYHLESTLDHTSEYKKRKRMFTKPFVIISILQL